MDLIEVRLLGPADTAVLDRVADDVFDHAVQSALAQAFLADPKNLLAVAIDDGLVVGMATALLYLHPDKPLQCFVNEVGVSPRWHRRGLGARLMRTLLAAARERGAEEAWVATEENNTPARTLYKSLDGAEDSDPAIVYTWPLWQHRGSGGTNPS
jgi:ribosomal protein S18 acetylase RimI-like enzyme